MPNWIEGSIKIRGPFENVKKFFTEGLNVYEYKYDGDLKQDMQTAKPKEEWLNIIDTDTDYLILYANPVNLNSDMTVDRWAYVEETRRAFVIFENEVWIRKAEDKDVIGTATIRQAWSFDTEDWINIAKTYNVDVKLYGLECGMGFGSEIEIRRDGAVLQDDDIVYKNWEWDCPFPWMGG